uniref:Uncharacterized protein n=1 Tax=Moniliophthora roreri TaxID=221103 RepID=A0A0W0G216_MONRR
MTPLPRGPIRTSAGWGASHATTVPISNTHRRNLTLYGALVTSPPTITKERMGRNTASPSIELWAARTLPHVASGTPVGSMATPTTTHRHMSEIFPIITCLKLEEWLATLDTLGLLEHYTDVPAGLRNGFHIRITNYYLPHTFIPDNHFTTEAEASIICAKFSQEVELGCLSPSFDPTALEHLIGPFRTAPMAMVEQKPGKFRIVINHSFPKPPPS